MAKGNATRIDTRDARLRVPSGGIASRPEGPHTAMRAGASYASVNGGVRSAPASRGGGLSSYTGRATNATGRR